ncbi:MAG TPA: Rid family detoxifying hydrolase [Thermoanaerobaculia bacterium]|jgi:2-iminobutanoate/2-iminopropanoate deaminase
MRFHHSDDAPRALGPYSHAVEVDGWLYVSGQTGIDPVTGELAAGGFEAEARQMLKNLEAVLAAAGCTFSHIVRAGIYLTDFANFPALNDLYGKALGDHRPARTTIQVAGLPKGAQVEIDVVARIVSIA